MSVQPLHQYVAWEFAEQSGMAEELGLDLEFTYLPQVDTAVQSLARGDLDMISTCGACNFPYLAQSPDLRDALIISQFKGFILVGQDGAPSYDALVEEGARPEDARQEVFDYLKGRTFVLRESAFGALVNGLLDEAGLTRDDVTILDVADDARAGQAFLQGQADFYMGSLAQESKLLRDYPDRAVNMGGAEILGPGGLWYDTMAVDQDWLDENPETMVKMAALWARVARYVTEKPDDVVPLITELINKNSGSTFSDEEIEQLLNDFLGFATLDRWENDTYNPNSDLYWKKSIDFYAAQNVTDGVLPESVDVDQHYVDEEIYNQLTGDQDLLDWVNAPLT
ncbi:ABC transporter substrate-binding protein [Microbacterium paraoxydans]|uniref:ABC transporter substrate-binding protein n=1 Tax=Microbacterium paraoxydans TaxID=199592 RepID=UPI001CFA91E8|nr:ABC transporter substrate-binding protein [Microbacterium paraoxydans]